MKVKKYTKAFAVVFTALLMAVILTVTAMAEIKVENGTVVGLDPAKNYQYAQVTLANYNAPTYNDVAAGSTKIEGLDVGLWYIYCKDDATKTAIWIEGDPEDRADIGEVYYSETYGKDVLRAVNAANVLTFQEGVWTGSEVRNHTSFPTYSLSATGAHVGNSYSDKIEAGTIDTEDVAKAISSVVYKYAYTSEEIIPVSELYTFSFSISIRQGDILPTYDETASDPSLKTKYVLYTMDETGNVTTHEALFDSEYVNDAGTKSTHSVSIAGEFPDAKGWVVGLDVYPYGSIPTDGLTFNAKDRYYNKDSNSWVHLNTCYYLTYMPNGYITEYNSGALSFPVQYNGANTAYIKGMGDGTFSPDKDITKAEMSTILARLLQGDANIPKGSKTRFSDVSISDWYFDAVNYLETRKVFDYVTGTRLNANKPLTRGEMVQMIQSIAKIETDSKASFKDVDESHPYYSAICAVESIDAINGYADGTFRPNATITRAEAVTIINRMINLVADEKTVIKSTLSNSFTDIDGHWAEYQILMSANSNVRSAHHIDAKTDGIIDNGTAIIIKNDHISVEIAKKNAKVSNITNVENNLSMRGATGTPWFTYLEMYTGVYFYPVNISIVDNRLEVTYSNGLKAYFIVDVHNNYFTVELDSEIPTLVKYIHFANLTAAYDRNTEPDSYRIASLPMKTNTNCKFSVGNTDKSTRASVINSINGIGGKIGIAFGTYGNIRDYLKEISAKIDPEVGLTSTAGGPYALDNKSLYKDYVIMSGGITQANVESVGDLASKYAVGQIDIHQGGSTFIQAEFNFKAALRSGETFGTGAMFKERIADVLHEKNIQVGLHTYSSLVPDYAHSILADPNNQRQICYEEKTYTLNGSLSSTSNTILTNEDTSAFVFPTADVPWNGPYTRYLLIDEEIILISGYSSNSFAVKTRGACGTIATEHRSGAEIRQLLGHFGMFQPIPGSDLFWDIADRTAKAYNEGGFDMIYLDGFESFSRAKFCNTDESYYYYGEFARRVVSQCIKKPIMEYSSGAPTYLWNARGRGGATDSPRRGYKQHKTNHKNTNASYYNNFYTSTFGWFHFNPDVSTQYKNTLIKTMFRDDLDHTGSLAIAWDISMVNDSFSPSAMAQRRSEDNFAYYTIYSLLRINNYFSPEVRDQLKTGKYEYKVFKQADGSWAFKEMKYSFNRVFDMADDLFVTGTDTNPFSAQTPYVRIEQRYSTLGANEVVVLPLDENASISTLAKKYSISTTDISDKITLKVRVFGNGSSTDAILIQLGAVVTSETGRNDYVIPLNFTGWREFILADADNADYGNYTFSGTNHASQLSYETFRAVPNMAAVNSFTIKLCGDCTGVKIDDIRACTTVDAPVKNPSVTVGSTKITFNTELHSGEFVEYYPETGKAYHTYYEYTYKKDTGKYESDIAHTKEITYTGTLTVPAGSFSYTYDAEAMTAAPTRARVGIGLSGKIIANPADWDAPEVNIPQEFIDYNLG